MTDTAPENTTPAKDEKREKALTKAYTLATKELRESNLAEFNQLRVKHSKALGYGWIPPKTAEQKALEEAQALIAAHPGIAEQLLGKTSEAEQGGPQFSTSPEEPAES